MPILGLFPRGAVGVVPVLLLHCLARQLLGPGRVWELLVQLVLLVVKTAGVEER